MTLDEGYVLTGGAGTRMGGDKASIVFRGQTLAARSGKILEPLVKTVTFVGGETVAGIPTISDVHPAKKELGPASIFGLHSAAYHSHSEWIAVLACDLPFITTDFFRLLISKADETSEAVVPVQPDGRLQPLAALYRTGACLAAIEQMLAEGNRRLQELFERLDTRRVLPAEYEHLPGSRLFFTNVNTPQDLEAALKSEPFEPPL
jgi:molybdopterin-guanine dinucleotide biosynthesis protein A